jgi:hypothetical protein
MKVRSVKIPPVAEPASVPSPSPAPVSAPRPIPPIKQVFDFSAPGEDDFWPSPDFANDLSHSESPFIILLVGNLRGGKSTRANQLLLHELRPTEPFKAAKGPRSVTTKFQYVGPLKFPDLAAIHGVGLPATTNPDVFIVDCEGLHSLAETTPSLKQATFALAQMVSLTVLVMKDGVNHANIDQIRSLFVLSHAFSRDIPGFTIGTVIMMRAVGVEAPEGEHPSLEEMNEIRRRVDDEQRQIILGYLNRASINFSQDDFLVLSQPDVDEVDLYWKSMNDFLIFAASIASARARIPGQVLLNLFNQVKPSILAVRDFEDPSIPFQQILATIACQYLGDATDFALGILGDAIWGHMATLNGDDLRMGPSPGFVVEMVRTCEERFEAKAEQLLPHLLEYSLEDTKAFRNRIMTAVQEAYHDVFMARYVHEVLPELQGAILDEIDAMIKAEVSEVSLPDLGAYQFTPLAERYAEEAVSRLRITTMEVNLQLELQPEYPQTIAEVRSLVFEYVRLLEQDCRQAHTNYMREEAERTRIAREAQFQEELQTVQREEARRRRRERERAEQELLLERERNAREQAVRVAATRQLQAQLDRQQKEADAARVARRRQAAAIAKMQADLEATRARAARERAEYEGQYQRDRASLQQQIAQLRALAARPRQVIVQRSSGSSCNVY